MKTLIIGCRGYLGRHLYKRYNPTIGTHYKEAPGALCLDLVSPCLDKLAISWDDYSYAIIASAITKIHYCEREPERTYAINVEGTLRLAEQLVARGIIPIFFSSTYVFDGTLSPYSETSKLTPLNEYGRQKAILEQELPLVCKGRYLILRIGKVYGTTRGDGTILDEIANFLSQGLPVRAAFDHVFSPLLIDDLIKGVYALQEQNCSGFYQLCEDEAWSRYDIACQVAASLNVDPALVEKISLDDLQGAVQRPKSTSMSNDKFKNAIKMSFSSLRSEIAKFSLQYKTSTM